VLPVGVEGGQRGRRGRGGVGEGGEVELDADVGQGVGLPQQEGGGGERDW
jgi:hypothetical protein